MRVEQLNLSIPSYVTVSGRNADQDTQGAAKSRLFGLIIH